MNIHTGSGPVQGGGEVISPELVRIYIAEMLNELCRLAKTAEQNDIAAILTLFEQAVDQSQIT